MTTPFAGPLARAWPGLDASRLADLLTAVALPVPTSQDRAAWAVVDRTTVDELAARAQADLGRPWPIPLAHQYARVHRDGDRDEYEQVVFARQRRLSRAAVMAAVTADDRWLDEVADGVVLLCEQSSWCWPAHDDTRTRHGAILPTADEPFLDLGAGEVVGQLAWVDHLLGSALEERWPGLRARIRTEAARRVLEPFVRRRDWHWLGLDGDVHNWSPWIHGNVLVAALQLVDGPASPSPSRAQLVALVIEGLDRYVASVPPDGAIDEGYAYWWNGAGRALDALDLLRHATGGALDAGSVPALRATVAFPMRMHLGGDWYLNVADGPARPSPGQPWAALHRAAVQVGDTRSAAHAASYRRPRSGVGDEGEGLGRLLRALTDPTWAQVQPPEREPLDADVWLPSTQVLLARPRTDSREGLTLAVKGGHNEEHHNHCDVGSVVLALHGVPFVVDAGRPTYTAQTFGPARYEIWTMQSAWHSTVTVRGSGQGVGRRYRARDVSVQTDDAATTMRLDLAEAYPLDGVRHWWRTASLDRADASVVLTDEWDLLPDPAGPSSCVQLLVAGEVSAVPGRALVEVLDGVGTVELTWEPPVRPDLTTRDLDDPMLSSVWGSRLTLLSLPAHGDHGRLVVTVREAS
ncbi:heparinase II/III family protein [Cellulomonas sp. URHE0023]|uniref:heparinase II/III domain-containing protein n=1 Tax=Cellulomonas sp. URHE0023 TaxID=1380354 RepID=UPI00068C7510|nr:heparinase II/III family protein [Cellulomonas sp. URHE0023]